MYPLCQKNLITSQTTLLVSTDQYSMPTDKNIKSPDILYSHFEKYREECKKSPKLENIYNYKADRTVPIEREIPLTWVGFENYLRRKKIITTLQDYEFNKDGRYKEYITIVRAIKNEIYEDKYIGAVAGIFQHNIIYTNVFYNSSVYTFVARPTNHIL